MMHIVNENFGGFGKPQNLVPGTKNNNEAIRGEDEGASLSPGSQIRNSGNSSSLTSPIQCP